MLAVIILDSPLVGTYVSCLRVKSLPCLKRISRTGSDCSRGETSFFKQINGISDVTIIGHACQPVAHGVKFPICVTTSLKHLIVVEEEMRGPRDEINSRRCQRIIARLGICAGSFGV
jgi:hypothetical protein